MKRVFASLLLSLPILVSLAPARADSPRTLDVVVSKFAFSPERIELKVGERVRLNVTSTEGTHGFQVKELDLNARIAANGQPVTLEFTPAKAGTFEIKCSEYCGTGHSRMKALLVVKTGE